MFEKQVSLLLAAFFATVASFTLQAALLQAAEPPADEIVIGTHQSLSGPLAPWGRPIANGMRMRVEQANAAGGIHGRALRLVVEDSGYDPSRAALATRKMVEVDRVFAILGTQGTPTSAVSLPIALEAGVPFLFPISGATMFFEPFDRLKYSFVVPTGAAVGAGLDYLLAETEAMTVCALYQDDAYGQGVLDGAKAALTSHGMKLAAAEPYARGETRFGAPIAKLRRAECELIVLGTIIRETVAAMAEAGRADWSPIFLVSPGGYTAEVAALGGDTVEGLYGVGQLPIPDPDAAARPVAEWLSDYEMRFGEAGGLPAIAGYNTIDLFVRAAEAAGPEPTVDRLIAALDAIRGYETIFGSTPVSFSPTCRLGSTEVFVARIEGGRWRNDSDFLPTPPPEGCPSAR
ncbi:MAG: ABC transporter substrate-binding protein [Rhodospirillaceae bacterium]|jgi:branched-chain amino acid transport system substrate-binding protein|nr:ABC transporter substrate-binding protein [Rhodospirillaceae bacterium]MBT6119180.1 ABC transporter substrate-binding protein [Rhodospirillaceae bacterium]